MNRSLKVVLASIFFSAGFLSGILGNRYFHILNLTPAQKMELAQESLWNYLGEEYDHKFDNYLKVVPKWLGIPTLQMPFDLFYLQELIVRVRPDFIIETGTYRGGASLFFASVLDQVHPSGKVITIDIRDLATTFKKDFALLQKYPVYNRHVEFIKGDSTSPEIVARIQKQVQGQRVLVTLDSDHEAEHVFKELEAYGPMVSIGSYLIVQDTYVDDRLQKVQQQPIIAVRRFLEQHPEFEIDNTRKPFLFTKYTDGVLKRVY